MQASPPSDRSRDRRRDPTAPFGALLEEAAAAARALERPIAGRQEEEGVLSLAMPLAPVDPLTALPQLESPELEGRGGFRFLWDGAPGLCLAAAGRWLVALPA